MGAALSIPRTSEFWARAAQPAHAPDGPPTTVRAAPSVSALGNEGLCADRQQLIRLSLGVSKEEIQSFKPAEEQRSRGRVWGARAGQVAKSKAEG